MSAVSGQLREIDQKFEKHMPKRPVSNVGPDVGNDFEEEASKARREEANRRFQQWAEKYKEEHKDEHKDEHKKKEPVFDERLTSIYGTPCFFTPNNE